MKLIKRLIYLVYYLKETNFRQLSKFIHYSSSVTGKSKLSITVDVIYCVLKYNISFKDYFCFRFYNISSSERNKWAGTGFMYEYQLQMNPKKSRELLENKISFLNHYKSFISRKFYNLDELKKDPQIIDKVMDNSSGRLVLKGSHGQVGAEVEVISCPNYTSKTLIDYMNRKNYDLVEEYVTQHHLLMEISPSGLNTVRIFTQLNKGKVEFLGARLRISINSPVDNMAAGNPAAPVDILTGIVNGPAVFSDITKEDITIHPVTGKTITGFLIPHWNAVLELVKNVALLTPENKSVGWDIAITEKGPELIEGNHNWCKLLWQLPVKQGLKKELEKYL